MERAGAVRWLMRECTAFLISAIAKIVASTELQFGIDLWPVICYLESNAGAAPRIRSMGDSIPECATVPNWPRMLAAACVTAGCLGVGACIAILMVLWVSA